MERGCVADCWSLDGCRTLEGSAAVGGQEHFYLEPNVTVCEPREEEEMILHASTQEPALLLCLKSCSAFAGISTWSSMSVCANCARRSR